MYPYGFTAQATPTNQASQTGAPQTDAPRERKRKWDVAGIPDQAVPPPATAPAIQPELAVQNAAMRLNQMLANRGMSTVHAFEKKVEINYCQPETRYYLCRGTTHEEIGRATQAALRVRGKYKGPGDMGPDEALHLYVTAPTQVQLDQALRMIDDVINRDKARGRGPEGNFQHKVFVGLENADPAFGLHGRILGPKGAYLKHIQTTANCRVTLKGRGSGFFEPGTNAESGEALYLHVQAGTKADADQAKQLTEDLLSTIRNDYYAQYGGLHNRGAGAAPAYPGVAPPPYPAPYGAPVPPPGPPPAAYPYSPYGAPVPGYPYPYPPAYPAYPGYPPVPPGPGYGAPMPGYPPHPPQPVQQPVAQLPQQQQPPSQHQQQHQQQQQQQHHQQQQQQPQQQPPAPRRFQERPAPTPEPEGPSPPTRRFQEAPQKKSLWGDSAEEEEVDDRTFGPERPAKGAADSIDSFYRDIGAAPAPSAAAAAAQWKEEPQEPQHPNGSQDEAQSAAPARQTAGPRKSVSFNPAPQVELFDKEEGIEARRGFFTPSAKALRMDGGGRAFVYPEPEPEPEQARVILEEDEPAFKLVDYGEEDAEPPSPPRSEPAKPTKPASNGPAGVPFWAMRG